MDDELLMAYFKGEVSDEEAQRITEWIEAKIEHQRYYQQLCRLFEMSYWIEDIPEQTEVAFPKKTKILPWKHYVISFMKVAAIFVLGFALHFFLNWQKTTHHELQHQIHVPTKVCRNTRCAFFFFIDYKNRLIFLSCDILRISLIYAFSTSK